ncbi:bifunctional endoribonuclease/protein kinase ire1 [Coemansia sp. RSA 552]|nr:bifunctional endoribonuclease/protein kinase ire1 [Coemansia sp. RSA 552]
MNWLRMTLWELCMSLLPHRNVRALLVPVLCIALLAPSGAPAGLSSGTAAQTGRPLFVGNSGVVPRKFTIAEPSVVAAADRRHTAMLPAKPYAAAAREHRLLRRDMVARSGVSLADIMVVTTVDGRIHGVRRFDGSIVWTRSDLLGPGDGPRSMVYSKGSAAGALEGGPEPLEGGSEPGEYEDEGEEEEEWLLEQGIDWRSDPQLLERLRRQQRAGSGGHDVLYIVEPGGALYVYSGGGGLQRLTLTVADLVDQSPVQVQGVLYTGRRHAGFAALDLATGRVGDAYTARVDAARVLVGERTDSVRVLPADGSGSAQWVLCHRAVLAPALDADTDALLGELGDAVDAGGPVKFVTTHDGGLVMVEATTGIPLWAQEFAAPVAGVMDVFAVNGPDGVTHVAQRRDLGPVAQQRRFRHWRQLHETDDEALARERLGWRGGSASGNVLAGAFWDRGNGTQAAYIGRLRDSLYVLTSDAFPLIDHATLTSSLLLALAQATRAHSRYPALQTAAWWDRWEFLTHDAVVLRVLRKARAWWLTAPADRGKAPGSELSDALLSRVADGYYDSYGNGGDDDRGQCRVVGFHPLERIPLPAIDGAPLGQLALPEGYSQNTDQVLDLIDDSAGEDRLPGDDQLLQGDDWPWWRYVGHYMTRVAAFIGYVVTIAALVSFAGAIYLLRPKAKRRPRMWVAAAGDVPGRRARLRVSWALMYRMWESLKGEWRRAVDDAWKAGTARRTAPTPEPNSAATSGSESGAPPAALGPTALADQLSLASITLSDQVLGYGSHGTVVYRGSFQGRAVAVKRLLLDFYDVADHEVQVLQESDTHPNVVRYFCTERHGHFMYIALELCCGSLADAVTSEPDASLAAQLLQAEPKRAVLRQLARGLLHLHALKLVHRDIKPQNILVAPPPRRSAATGAPRVLISDFGLSRILDDDESSFANTFTMRGVPAAGAAAVGGGTVGWRAPECFDAPAAPLDSASELSSCEGPFASRGTRSRLHQLAMSRPADPGAEPRAAGSGPDSRASSSTADPDSRASSSAVALPPGARPSRRRMTRAVDIFSMGCVFYYVLMNGEHPFGDRLTREQRILSGAPDLRALEASNVPAPIDAVDLIAHMVARSARDRPSAASVLAHPYFWDAAQRLAFLQDVSDCLEAEARLIKAAREDVPGPPKKQKTPKKKQPPASEEAKPKPPESTDSILARLPPEQAAAVRRAIALLDAFEENSALVMEPAPPPPDGFQVVGADPPRRIAWVRRLDPHLRRDLGKFRKYDAERLRDLLRTIRNKKNHYQDMPLPLRETLGDIPDGYLHYFESRFPYLLLHCYYFVLEDDSLRTATVFRPYFRAPTL